MKEKINILKKNSGKIIRWFFKNSDEETHLFDDIFCRIS